MLPRTERAGKASLGDAVVRSSYKLLNVAPPNIRTCGKGTPQPRHGEQYDNLTTINGAC